MEEDELDELLVEQKNALQNFQNILFGLAAVSMESQIQSGEFADAVAIALDNHPIDMIIMGVNAGDTVKRNYIENHAMQLVDLERCPVLVIPPAMQFNQIDKVAIAVRLEDAASHLPLSTMKEIAKKLEAEIHIVCVDPEIYISLTEKQQQLRNQLAEMLEVPVEFAFLRLFDVQEAIEMYVNDKGIDVLVTIPHSAGLMGLTSSDSQTARLSYDSKVPVLAIPSNLG